MMGADASDNSCYNVGYRTGMMDAAGSEAWSYDSMGRIKVDQRTTNSVTKTTTYATASVPYNYDGSIAQMIYPSGTTITYTPSGAARPIAVYDSANDYASGASYTPPGELTALTLGQAGNFTGINLSQGFSPMLQPTSIRAWSTNGVALDLSYCFYPLAAGVCPSSPQGSNNGNVTMIANNLDNTRSQLFTYDALNRLSTAGTASTTGSNCWGEQYGYDAWGNLLSIAAIAQYTGCTQESGFNYAGYVNGSNQITATGFLYDTAGNLTSSPNPNGLALQYDAEGHTASANGVTYSYDGDGKRVQKSSGTMYWYGKGRGSPGRKRFRWNF